MADSHNSEILIVPSPDVPAKGGKGLLGGGPMKLNTDTLRDNLKGFLASISQMLNSIPESTGGYKLDEIELKMEINAEGNIQLVGGIKTGATGGITLRLKR